MAEDDFFVGWNETPAADRRFFLKAGAGLLLGTAGAAGLAALLQTSPGPGTWDISDEREWTGLLLTQPYPMLRTRDLDGTLRTALISCAGKCGGQQLLEGMRGGYVAITGSLVSRGQNALISVTEAGPWLQQLNDPVPTNLVVEDFEPLGATHLNGEILDSKCWFGAMRPASGKVHKSCAALCIRGGIPPAFYAEDRSGNGMLLIMTDGVRAFGDDLLEYVADPVRISGQIQRESGLYFLRTSINQITRM